MNSNLKLPKGITLFDEVMIEHLCKDEIFLASSEENVGGKILKMYPDWESGHLVYELSTGECKYSELTKLIKQLNEMNYMAEYQN